MSRWTLGRAAGDFIAYVQLFREAPAGYQADATALRAQLLGLLDAFTKDPAAKGVAGAEIEEARFALVAWADEMILLSQWAGHELWLREPLQLHLFRTNRAGDEFFEHLARLRPEQTDAREIYFLCLALGFEGQYADRDSERRGLVAQQFEMLRVAGRAADVASHAPLSPRAYDVEIHLRSGRRSGVWRSLGLMLLLSGVIFCVIFGVLYLVAGSVPPPSS